MIIIPTPHFTPGDTRHQLEEIRRELNMLIDLLNRILPSIENQEVK